MNNIESNTPTSRVIERNLLGILLYSDEVRNEMVPFLKSEDFAFPQNQIIFENIQKLTKIKRQTFDISLLVHYLDIQEKLKDSGGKEYIKEITDSYVSKELADHYFQLLLDISTKRKIQKDLKKLHKFIQAKSSGHDFISEIKCLLAELEIFYHRKDYNLVALVDVVKNTLTDQEKFINGKEKFINGKKPITCSTGFLNLDQKTRGFQKGELIILAARPSMGKTALALDMAMANFQNFKADSGETIIFSLEMSPQQLAHRVITAKSKLFDTKILNENNDIDIQKFITQLAKKNVFIDTSTGLDVLKINAILRERQKKRPIKLVIIDYLQLLKPLQKNRSENRNLEVSTWTRELKETAQHLEIPILCLSQLSRNVERREDKRPYLSDLRDSGSIEQDADIVMFLYRENYYARQNDNEGEPKNQNLSEPHKAEIIISKHRNGPIGVVEVLFIPKKTTFLEINE